jgi:hypothetical protein
MDAAPAACLLVIIIFHRQQPQPRMIRPCWGCRMFFGTANTITNFQILGMCQVGDCCLGRVRPKDPTIACITASNVIFANPTLRWGISIKCLASSPSSSSRGQDAVSERAVL